MGAASYEAGTGAPKGPAAPGVPRGHKAPLLWKPRRTQAMPGDPAAPRRAHLGEAALALIRVGREPGRVIHRHGPSRPPESSLLSVRERAEARREAAASGRMRELLPRGGRSPRTHARTPA